MSNIKIFFLTAAFIFLLLAISNDSLPFGIIGITFLIISFNTFDKQDQDQDKK